MKILYKRIDIPSRPNAKQKLLAVWVTKTASKEVFLNAVDKVKKLYHASWSPENKYWVCSDNAQNLLRLKMIGAQDQNAKHEVPEDEQGEFIWLFCNRFGDGGVDEIKCAYKTESEALARIDSCAPNESWFSIIKVKVEK